MTILNVTEEEFSRIKIAEKDLDPLDFERYIRLYFTSGKLGVFKVVVRKDVPYIPFDVRNVRRIEEDEP